MTIGTYLAQSAAILTELAAAPDLPGRLERAITVITTALGAGKPLLVCGNGGSAADALHIAGELVGRYKRDRRAFKVYALAADSAVLTAWSNDFGYETVFSRQVEAYGEAGAVLLGLSTSGNSPNVLRAFEAARSIGMTSIAMTGAGGGRLAAHADLLLDVPSKDTPLIQQGHICLYHYLCAEVEQRLAEAA